MITSLPRYLLATAFAAWTLLLLALAPLPGCLSNPTPHPGQATTDNARDDTDDDYAGAPDGMEASEGGDASDGPPCAPGDAYVDGYGDALGDATAADAGDVGPVDGGGMVGCDPGPSEEDPDAPGASSQASTDGR